MNDLILAKGKHFVIDRKIHAQCLKKSQWFDVDKKNKMIWYDRKKMIWYWQKKSKWYDTKNKNINHIILIAK